MGLGECQKSIVNLGGTWRTSLFSHVLLKTIVTLTGAHSQMYMCGCPATFPGQCLKPRSKAATVVSWPQRFGVSQIHSGVISEQLSGGLVRGLWMIDGTPVDMNYPICCRPKGPTN